MVQELYRERWVWMENKDYLTPVLWTIALQTDTGDIRFFLCEEKDESFFFRDKYRKKHMLTQDLSVYLHISIMVSTVAHAGHSEAFPEGLDQWPKQL